MNKQKPIFLLDCVNSKNSCLKPYNCKADIHLFNYFAFKSRCKIKTTTSYKLKSPSSKPNFPTILDNPKPSNSLPALKSHRSEPHPSPLSHSDLKALIQKYRLKN